MFSYPQAAGRLPHLSSEPDIEPTLPRAAFGPIRKSDLAGRDPTGCKLGSYRLTHRRQYGTMLLVRVAGYCEAVLLDATLVSQLPFAPDQALAERLKAAVERKDANARVFFAPLSLRAGGFWSRTAAQELEYDEAFEKRVKFPDFPVVLVLLEGQTAPGLPFLRRLHWIITPDPSSEKDVARLFDAASGSGTRPGELWRYTSPYRGLAAMVEKDSDYFFGREEKTVEVLKTLAAAPGELSILLGNSGVGKSSVAQAGVLAALKRQAWPEAADAPTEWPHAFQESRRWCFLTLKPGTEPLKALVEMFFEHWQLGATDPERVKKQNGWIELLRDGKAMLRDLLDATERRYKELDQTKPPAFLLYIDQGEELYVRAEECQRRR